MRVSLGLCLLVAVSGCNGHPLAESGQDAAPAAVQIDGATDTTISKRGDTQDAAPPPVAEAGVDTSAMLDAGVTFDVAPAMDAVATADVGASEVGPTTDGSVDASDAGCAGDAQACAPSCAGGQGAGLASCGPNHESCCTSLVVPGGTFYRSYDGVSCPGGAEAQPLPFLGCYLEKNAPATVSSFRLDKYLVTIGRFRRFIDAVVGGWTPPAGSGRHPHLADGQGLADLGTPGAFEKGWDPAWTATLPRTREDWDTQFGSEQWSGSADVDLDRPVGSLFWAEAYAFCIWDGGFLPTEAEWNYAAAGGDQQRVYPWSNPPTAATVDCDHAFYDLGCPGQQDFALVGSRSPMGDGRWGHADLVGNMDQWTLDWLRDYVTPAIDGAQLTPGLPSDIVDDSLRTLRGATQHGNVGVAPFIVAGRDGEYSDGASSVSGVRCARAP